MNTKKQILKRQSGVHTSELILSFSTSILLAFSQAGSSARNLTLIKDFEEHDRNRTRYLSAARF